MNIDSIDDSQKYIEWWRTNRGRQCIVKATDITGNRTTYHAKFLTPPEFIGAGIRVFCLGIDETGCMFSTAHRDYEIRFLD